VVFFPGVCEIIRTAPSATCSSGLFGTAELDKSDARNIGEQGIKDEAPLSK
jgi:hypothetical protein